MTIDTDLYQSYLASLLSGDRQTCRAIVTDLLEEKIEIRKLYTELFQKSMYRVGELWETNQLSVAREHLATSITENMLSITYPYLFSGQPSEKKAVISCTANEYHQLGGKMVADILEFHGWDAQFFGVNNHADVLLKCIDEIKPDLIGLSLAVDINLPVLRSTLDTIYTHFKNLDIIVGGHAFVKGGTEMLKNYPGIHYIESLEKLEADVLR